MKESSTCLPSVEKGVSLHFCVILVSCLLSWSLEVQAKPPLSTQELLGLLPQASKLAADIPTHQFDLADVTRENVIEADVNMDGVNEIIIAYYTPPHEISSQRGDEGFFRRAHVKVLRFHSGNWEELWDSGGWGTSVRGRMPSSLSAPQQEEYTRNYFTVEHFVGSEAPLIVFARSSFLAEGMRFEVWRWETDKFVKMLELPTIARITRSKGGTATEIVQDLGWKGKHLETMNVYRFDQGVFKMSLREATDE